MHIHLHNVGKRYAFGWVLRDVEYTFREGRSYAVTGPNGAGKSTLLKMLSGHLTPTKGKVQFYIGDNAIPIDAIYQHITFAAPWIDIVEELTLREMVTFHRKFKPFVHNYSVNTFLEILPIRGATDRHIRHFSSGMKQRLRLLLAILSDSAVVFLDEPTTNLDAEGVAWYREIVQQYATGRTLIIASNVEHDFDFCTEQIDVEMWKR